MLKNALIMVVDDVAVCATRRRLDDGAYPAAYGCTTCTDPKSEWIYLFDLTQHGMFEDEVRTVVECSHCHAQFFFQYMIPSYDVIPEADNDNS